MNFVAIDFETANVSRNSACAVGIVSVENDVITDEFYTLIKPPENTYQWQYSRVHKIKANNTVNSPSFNEIYPEIRRRLKNKIVVAHGELFDREVLQASMKHHKLNYKDLNLPKEWEDTCKIYSDKGLEKPNLKACCEQYKINLQHHNALSDAKASAILYINKDVF